MWVNVSASEREWEGPVNLFLLHLLENLRSFANEKPAPHIAPAAGYRLSSHEDHAKDR